MISASEFIQRRERLLNSIPSKYATLLISAATTQKRIPTIPYKFVQHSDMLYLAGYDRPNGILALTKSGNEYYSHLFLPPSDNEAEMWEGFRTPFDEAQKVSGVQKVLPIFEFQDWLRRNMIKHRKVYESTPAPQTIIKESIPLSPYIDNLRVIKSRAEQENIKKSVLIARNSMFAARKSVKAGIYEAEIAETFKKEAVKEGASGFPYQITAASGPNSLYFHYQDNNRKLNDGESVIIDAGVEYNHYASDLSRTIHIGNIPRAHHEMIMMVEDIKNTLKRYINMGAFINLDHINQKCLRMMKKGLKKWGIKTTLSDMRVLCPHACAHWIGLDVHDTPSIPQTYELRSGVAFAIEPALYFNPENPNVPKELAGFGVRFEDTIIYE